MTERERFLRVLNFEKPGDRLPMIEWAAWWDKTIERWKGEGLPVDLDRRGALRHFGLDVLICIRASSMSPGCPSAPHDDAGIIQDEASYEAILPHLYPVSSIEGLVTLSRELKPRHDRGEFTIRLWLDGFFWWPRILFGIEPHLYAFYDQPELMHRINRDQADFQLRTLSALFEVLQPDMVGFAEDMSYNNGPMLSKELFDEFLAPYYRQVVPVIRQHGVKVLVDTDGQVEPMVPWLEEVGIEGVYPLERQSGVNVARIRRNHPKFLMMGGYDKMVMPQGEAAMRAEFERLLPVMRSGGFIPSVDHQTPPGVSLENYRIYVRLLSEYAHMAAQRQDEPPTRGGIGRFHEDGLSRLAIPANGVPGRTLTPDSRKGI